MSIDFIDFTSKDLLNKAIAIYGESGSGKSYLIRDFMGKLCDHISQVIVFSASETRRPSYGKFVPEQCIHASITEHLLDALWSRQEALVSVYNRANKLPVLSGLFLRYASDNERKLVGGIIASCAKAIDSVMAADSQNAAAAKEKSREIQESSDLFLRKVYAHILLKHHSELAPKNDDERITIKFLGFNPQLLVIFDDCTSEIRKFQRHPVIDEIFFAGRHSLMTAIFALHTDQALTPEQKKNAHVTIFTQRPTAIKYFGLGSGGFDSTLRKAVSKACDMIFGDSESALSGLRLQTHEKLVWISKITKFYKYKAGEGIDKPIGAQIIIDFCKNIKNKSGGMVNNVYSRRLDSK